MPVLKGEKVKELMIFISTEDSRLKHFQETSDSLQNDRYLRMKKFPVSNVDNTKNDDEHYDMSNVAQ